MKRFSFVTQVDIIANDEELAREQLSKFLNNADDDEFRNPDLWELDSLATEELDDDDLEMYLIGGGAE